MMFTLIPLPYKILGLVIIIAAVGSLGYFKGYTTAVDKAEQEKIKYMLEQEQKYAELLKKKNKVEEKIVIEYVDRIQYITKWRTKNVEVVKLVPDTGELSNGWVHVHNSSAEGRNADSAAAADATPSGIGTAEAVGTISDNYATCHETAERLKALQGWVVQMQALYGEKK